MGQAAPAYLRTPVCAEQLIRGEGRNFVIPYAESVLMIQAPRNYGHIATPPRPAGSRSVKNGESIRPYVVSYRGKMFRKFTLDKCEGWPAPCLVRVEGKIPPGAKRMMVTLHGMGSTYSHMGAWLPFLDGVDDKLPDTAVMALDLPRHGFLKASPWEPSFSELVQQLIRELEGIKRESSIPITLLGRSASAGLALQVAKDRPDLVDRLVLIAPTPSQLDLLVRVEAGIDRMVNDGLLTLHPPSFDYAYRLMRQMKFHEWNWSKWKVSTDIYYSLEDPEGDETIREYWNQLAAQTDFVRISKFPGKRHDPFIADDAFVREQVWKRFTQAYLP